MIDLADYYSGGYFLVRADKPDWEQLNALPEKLISLSNCICPSFYVWWGWNPGDREAAVKFGIPETKLDEFVEWCGDAFAVDIAYPSIFYSVDAARRFVDRFLPNTDGLYLIGAGLYKPLEAGGWNLSPEQMRIKNTITVNLLLQTEMRAIEGVEDQIEQHMLLAEGGIPLGFEVVSYAYHNFGHSWLCSGLQKEMHDLFEIEPGQYGLIQSREEAEKVCKWIMEPNERGNHRGEPEPYAYWLLVSYPLSLSG